MRGKIPANAAMICGSMLLLFSISFSLLIFKNFENLGFIYFGRKF
jgi:hypothetical protein